MTRFRVVVGEGVVQLSIHFAWLSAIAIAWLSVIAIPIGTMMLDVFFLHMRDCLHASICYCSCAQWENGRPKNFYSKGCKRGFDWDTAEQ